MKKQFRIPTDTASLVIFDPQDMQHRVNDRVLWTSAAGAVLSEINQANMLVVELTSDGIYAVTLTDAAAPEHAPIDVVLKVDSGTLYIGGGETIPGGGISPRKGVDGEFVDLHRGLYRVCVVASQSKTPSITVYLTPTRGISENELKAIPRLFDED